jgi:ribosomal protein S18 acetylase RimI-like enzyme
MLRELRPADAPRVAEFLRQEFPAEEAILGTRPEGIAKVVQRIFRWDLRFLLALMRLVNRAPFRFFVIADGGRIVATTLLSFPPAAGYLSMVVVDPACRRRGYARRLLEAARTGAGRRRRPFMVLDVLQENAPARQLYESSGYRTLRSTAYLVLDMAAVAGGPGAAPSGVRPFRPSDAGPLAEIAQRTAPPEVARVLPTRPKELVGSGIVERVMSSEIASWVVDRGHGPEAFLSAVVTPITEAAHLSAPIVAESVEPPVAMALVRTAVAWVAARRAPRLVALVPDDNTRGRAALAEVGFRNAFGVLTLYRPTA